MHHNKQKAKESKPEASQAKPVSRMDTLLQEIDKVISKEKPADSAKRSKK